MSERSRRQFVSLGLGLGAVALVGCSDEGQAVDPNDEIFEGACSPLPNEGTCTVTNEDIEGPYYQPSAPERSDLDTVGDEGVALTLSGVVHDASCTPLPGARVEIWHANPEGAYDNSPTGHYRGWVACDDEGRYTFTTLVPGRYLNGDDYRPSHIHMKVWVGDAERLTTQVYFADDPYLDADPWAEPSRTVCLEEDGAGVAAIFDVTLA